MYSVFLPPARPLPAAASDLDELAGRFAPISLAQMDGVALLDRVDLKFALTRPQLLAALAALTDEYRILEIAGRRLHRYHSLYFDTPDFRLYHAHLTGQAERYKVRSRVYTDSGLAFLEVKHRTRKGRTLKERRATPQPLTALDEPAREWLAGLAPALDLPLGPRLGNNFRRLTLVSRHTEERLTLDIDLAFGADDRLVQLDGVAVAEVKMPDRHSRTSPFLAQMRAQRLQPRSFSKYALGVALLVPQIKKNPLKPHLLWLERLPAPAAPRAGSRPAFRPAEPEAAPPAHPRLQECFYG